MVVTSSSAGYNIVCCSQSLPIFPPQKETFTMVRTFILTAVCSVALIGFISQNCKANHIFHVASNGNDNHSGTIEKPFRTIQHVQQQVRKIVANGLKENVTISLHAGMYRIVSSLMFDIKDSGTQKHRITYSAYKDEKVIISGGREIKGWRPLPNGNWQVLIPEVKAGKWNFRELFINGKRCIRARHPNKGYSRIIKAGADNRTSFRFDAKDILLKDAGTETELVFLHDWSTSRIQVKSIDQKNRVLTLKNKIGPVGRHYAIDHFEKHPRYYLENHAAFLDVAGEWFLDRKSGLLTYRPQQNETIEKSSFIAPVAPRLLEVKGTPKQPVTNLHFKGITFQYCSWMLPPHGYVAGQAAFHEPRDGSKLKGGLRVAVPAAIVLKNVIQCQLEKCNIRHLGGSGISFEKGCHHCVISGSHLSDISANGVMIGHGCTGNQLTNSTITQTGQQFFGSIGIWIGLANHTIISNNEISFMPYTGISVGWKWNPSPTSCHHNIIEKNHIHHVMQTLSDGAGIYTLGRQPGTVLRMNQIHDVSVNAGRAESNGIFMDEGTTEILVEKNNIYNIARSPIRFHRAEENTIRNNRLVTQKGIPAFRYNSTKPEKIKRVENNITEQK